jgi:tRNA-specific 2-thiouridylase
LARSLFPIGELLKPEVRDIARKAGIATAEKKDSQGLCFIGKVHLPDFLQQQLKPRKGKVIEVPASSALFSETEQAVELAEVTRPYALNPQAGEVVGEHNGAHYYTIGQRRGLNLGGFEKPLFVIGTDTKDNILYTGMGENHPGLYRRGLFLGHHDHWVREDLNLAVGDSQRYMARIRYRQPLEPCIVHRLEEGVYIVFDRPQRGITPGQFAAWYAGDELVGSGVIS